MDKYTIVCMPRFSENIYKMRKIPFMHANSKGFDLSQQNGDVTFSHLIDKQSLSWVF